MKNSSIDKWLWASFKERISDTEMSYVYAVILSYPIIDQQSDGNKMWINYSFILQKMSTI